MHDTEVALTPFFTLILFFLPDISLFVPSFGFVFIPIIKVVFRYQLLLFSIYEDLAVAYFIFYFSGGEAKVQLEQGVRQTVFCGLIMHEADPYLGSDFGFTGLLLSQSPWKVAFPVPPRVGVYSERRRL